jgi:photosystem II stability/assembly factor-like uncharacterized protein
MNLSYAILAALALAASVPAAGAGFVDVLDTPAQASPLAGKVLLQAVARAGSRLVAVGQRGHIVVSGDDGATWKQSAVPVSSDLTAVYFVDEHLGWAVGHDGVILHSANGGERWEVQLTGRKANDLLVAAMERKAAAEPASGPAKAFLGEAQRFKEQGADKPFLDVWFADGATGYAVGAYNLLFRTVDGGRNWEPWFDRTDNPKLYNLYAIRPAGGELYVAGESGLVLKLDNAAQRFRALAVPYNGSFFGLADAGTAMLAFGLRGNVFRSADAGKSWTRVDTGLRASIVGATCTAQGELVLADTGGRAAASTDGGATFKPLALARPVPLTGLVALDARRFALVGPRGAAVTNTAP